MAFGAPLVEEEAMTHETNQPETETEVLQLDGSEVQAIPSLCMSCEKEGLTRIMLTKVPHFRELVIMAFECPHCNESNNEVQFAGQLQPRGSKITVKVPAGDHDGRNRQVVKSDSATFTIPELEFEVPPESQKGSLTTVEGLLRKAAEDLRLLQDERRRVAPEVADSLDAFLQKVDSCADGSMDFTLVVDDPAGNSFVQSLNPPAADPQMTIEYYDRSAEQNAQMGYLAPETAPVPPNGEPSSAPELSHATSTASRPYVPAGTTRGAHSYPHGSVGALSLADNRNSIASGTGETPESVAKYTAPEEVMVFPGHCSACGAKGEQRMFVTNIPYFKEVIVMASSCDTCGYKSSELKAGGRIPEKGKRIALRVKSNADLTRDVIKSDTASVAIPEVELELTAGTLGGRVTTVEGLIADISESLKRVQGFSIGDSAPEWQRITWNTFDANLKKLMNVEAPWTLILDDAMANSFIAPLVGDMEEDPQLVVEEYERSFDQNEELGLNDMDAGDGDGNTDQGGLDSVKEEVKE